MSWRSIPLTSPAPPLEEMAEGEMEGGDVQTAEVHFVPPEGDLQVVELDDEDDVVIEEDVVVLEEGDATGVEKVEEEDDVE